VSSVAGAADLESPPEKWLMYDGSDNGKYSKKRRNNNFSFEFNLDT